MTATRDNLIAEARNIRLSLPGLSPDEMTKAIREVLRHYAPHSKPDYLDDIIQESRINLSETA